MTKALLLLLFFTSCTTPRPWTRGEVALGIASTIAAAWDARTTTEMLDRGGRELSPLMDEHPSDDRVWLTIGAGQIVTLAVAHWIPTITLPVFGVCELRVPILIGKTALNAGFAWHNTTQVER